MSELALLPAFTSAGLAAIAAAHGQGLSLKITHLAFGDTAYDVRDGDGVPLAAGRARVALENERVRVAVAAGNAVTPNSILVVGEVPAAIPEFWIKEVGFFAEDGTLVAVWSMADQTLGWRGANAPWLFKFVLSWSDLPPNAITVVFDGDATLSALATDMARLDAKVHHTVVIGGIAWDDLDETQLTEAIVAMIAGAIATISSHGAGDGLEVFEDDFRVKLNGATLLRAAAGLSLNLGQANAWAAGQSGVPVPVDDAAPAINLSGANVFYWSMGGARTLPAPTGISAGQSGVIWLRPNTHPLFYHNFWQFPAAAIPTVSTAAAARDLLVYEVDETAEHATCALIKGSA